MQEKLLERLRILDCLPLPSVVCLGDPPGLKLPSSLVSGSHLCRGDCWSTAFPHKGKEKHRSGWQHSPNSVFGVDCPWIQRMPKPSRACPVWKSLVKKSQLGFLCAKEWVFSFNIIAHAHLTEFCAKKSSFLSTRDPFSIFLTSHWSRLCHVCQWRISLYY